jgi:hypothetical protein
MNTGTLCCVLVVLPFRHGVRPRHTLGFLPISGKPPVMPRWSLQRNEPTCVVGEQRHQGLVGMWCFKIVRGEVTGSAWCEAPGEPCLPTEASACFVDSGIANFSIVGGLCSCKWPSMPSARERRCRVRKVISRSGNRSDPRPDRERLPCMAVGPLSRRATIKGGQAEAHEPTFAVPTVPPQTLATKTDQEGAEARGLAHLATNRRPSTQDSDRHRCHVFLLFVLRYTHIIPRL